jgi:hypothetical protein
MEMEFSIMFKPLETFANGALGGLDFATVQATSAEDAQRKLETQLGHQVAVIHVEIN